jgi:hypothetical protein
LAFRAFVDAPLRDRYDLPGHLFGIGLSSGGFSSIYGSEKRTPSGHNLKRAGDARDK